MAWNEVLPVEQRARFVLEADKAELSITELCCLYGVSRKTGYKWIRRYRAEGLDGVRERNSRPHNSPYKTSHELEVLIIKHRIEHPNWGPKKLRHILKSQYPGYKIPAPGTIGNIIKRAGLVNKNKRDRKRKPYYNGELTQPQYPNHIWAVDYKGWFRTEDGKRCEPLTISDLYTRYVLEVKALDNQSYEDAKLAFERVFKEYGVPEIIRSDNGSPFSSIGAGGLSRLSVWWVELGIKPQRIAKGHPEQNGSHERMHQTLKKEATKPRSNNIRSQQRRFDRWKEEFNKKRPHEALGMKTPQQLYCKCVKHDMEVRQIVYPDQYEIRRVRSNGEIKWKGRLRFIGEALRGKIVGIKQVDNDYSEVYFDTIQLGELHNMDKKGIRKMVGVYSNNNELKV